MISKGSTKMVLFCNCFVICTISFAKDKIVPKKFEIILIPSGKHDNTSLQPKK